MEGEGVSPVRIKALDNRVEKWRGIVTARMELTEQEVISKAAVVEMMHEKNLTTYTFYDDNDEKRIVSLTAKESLKFKKDKGEMEEDSTDSDDE